MAGNKTEQNKGLEEKLAELDETIRNLEAKDISLEDSFKLYQNGMTLLKECHDEIDAVEKKVKILSEEGEVTGELQ